MPLGYMERWDFLLPHEHLFASLDDIPIGHEEFVQAELRATTEKHQTLVERIPLVQDTQSAWLQFLPVS